MDRSSFGYKLQKPAHPQKKVYHLFHDNYFLGVVYTIAHLYGISVSYILYVYPATTALLLKQTMYDP